MYVMVSGCDNVAETKKPTNAFTSSDLINAKLSAPPHPTFHITSKLFVFLPCRLIKHFLRFLLSSEINSDYNVACSSCGRKPSISLVLTSLHQTKDMMGPSPEKESFSAEASTYSALDPTPTGTCTSLTYFLWFFFFLASFPYTLIASAPMPSRMSLTAQQLIAAYLDLSKKELLDETE